MQIPMHLVHRQPPPGFAYGLRGFGVGRFGVGRFGIGDTNVSSNDPFGVNNISVTPQQYLANAVNTLNADGGASAEDASTIVTSVLADYCSSNPYDETCQSPSATAALIGSAAAGVNPGSIAPEYQASYSNALDNQSTNYNPALTMVAPVLQKADNYVPPTPGEMAGQGAGWMSSPNGISPQATSTSVAASTAPAASSTAASATAATAAAGTVPGTTTTSSWFTEETVVPNVPNWALLAVPAAFLLFLAVIKK